VSPCERFLTPFFALFLFARKKKTEIRILSAVEREKNVSVSSDDIVVVVVVVVVASSKKFQH